MSEARGGGARRLAGWIGTAALVALAAVAVATAPGSEEIAAPLEVTGELGETIETRKLDVAVTALSTADVLEPAYAELPGSTRTTGVWLVIDATVEPRIENLSFEQTELQIGDARYRVSPLLPSPSLTSLVYNPGLPVAGSLVVELPASALTAPGAEQARIVFRSGFTAVPDTMAVVVVDLTGLDRAGTALIEPAAVIDR